MMHVTKSKVENGKLQLLLPSTNTLYLPGADLVVCRTLFTSMRIYGRFTSYIIN